MNQRGGRFFDGERAAQRENRVLITVFRRVSAGEDDVRKRRGCRVRVIALEFDEGFVVTSGAKKNDAFVAD